MKVKKITRIDSSRIEVLKIPNFIEKIFGIKPKSETYYIDLDRVYAKRQHVNIIYNSKGEVLSIYDNIGEKIQSFINLERFK